MSGIGRTLDTISRQTLFEQYFMDYVAKADWPDEYEIRVINKERIWDGYFHPSSHVKPGALELYYMFHPDFHIREAPHPPSVQLNFQIGTAMHALLESMFIHAGFTTEEECETSFVNEERWAAGALDVRRAYSPRDGQPYPVDFKSCSHIPKQPSDQYIDQLNIYMDLGDPEHGPYDRGVLLYVSKLYPPKVKEFVVYRDAERLEQIYSKWAEVKGALDANDPSSLRDCCLKDSKTHKVCQANMICRIGKPEVTL